MDEGFFEEQNDKFDLAQNSSLYSLPADFLAMRQLRLAYSGSPSSPSDYKISTAYDPTDIHLVSADEENIPTANPIHNITATYIRIKPTPTQAVTNGGRIFYIAMPSALVNTGDIPNLPVQYQALLAEYGIIQMAFKYEKWNKHDRAEKKWNTAIGELMEVLADRDRNKSVRMKSPLEIGPPNHTSRREIPPYGSR